MTDFLADFYDKFLTHFLDRFFDKFWGNSVFKYIKKGNLPKRLRTTELNSIELKSNTYNVAYACMTTLDPLKLFENRLLD